MSVSSSSSTLNRSLHFASNESPELFSTTNEPRKDSEAQSSTVSGSGSKEVTALHRTSGLSDYAKTARKRIKSTFPKTYSLASRFLIYVRGPRPKIDLPDVSPWLLRVKLRNSVYGSIVEPSFIRYTRHLTYPLLFIVLVVIYIISLAFFSRAQSYLTPASAYVDCTSTFWLQNADCGLDGNDCGPFDFNSPFDFRCPSQCANTKLSNPRTVGNEQIAFRPLIVGGGDANSTYRGDSFICAAAEQAGLFSDSRGGCGTLRLIANFSNFTPQSSNGLSSIGFPSIFPVAFRFEDSIPFSHCTDLRNYALIFNAFVTFILFAFLRPKPIVLFWSLACIGFWHITLFSQPRSNPPDLADAFGTFLPALFICYVFWRVAFRFTLPKFATRVPIEGAILYLGPYWVTVLANLTTERIPIDRLTPEDIRAQPGGIAALIIICVVLLVIVVNQIRTIRKTGWLPHYLFWYICGGLLALVLSLLPTLNLRVHHYFIAIVLMPGTAFPTRLSAIYQGFLLGLFLNGSAAFGFDSILQTAAQLQRDAALRTATPTFLTNSSTYNPSIPLSNQILSWSALPTGEDWDGFLLLVDDVERYFGTALNFSLAGLQEGLPHFFRIAFTVEGTPGGFTNAATLFANGTWVNPAPGTT